MDALTSMKPFQIVLLVVFGFLLILGLVLFANYSGGGSGAKVGSVVIWGTLPSETMGSVLGSLTLRSQDYAAVSYEQKSLDTFDTDLAEAIATGNGPDLILISQEQLLTERGKLSVIPFSSISERTYLNSYLPIDELFLASNGTYGIPFAVDPLVMYYNRGTLTNAGQASPPSTWEGITALAEQLSRSSSGTVSQSTIPFGAYDNLEDARAVVSLLMLQAGNPIVSVGQNGPQSTLTDAGNSTAATTPAQGAMAFYTQFSDPAKTVYSWNRAIPSARQAFLAGTLAFYPGFASELPLLKQSNPNLDFDMMPVPQPQNVAKRVTYGNAYAFAVPATSKNASGALTAAFALTDASLAPAVSQALFMAPATRASLTPANNDRYAPVYYPQALIAQGWLSPSPSKTDTIFSTMISNITSGKLGVAQALQAADQAIDAAL